MRLAAKGRIYVQVKTRIKPIIHSDIAGALARFDTLCADHESGLRRGKAQFFVVMNQPPGPQLLQAIHSGQMTADVKLIWPGSEAHAMQALHASSPSRHCSWQRTTRVNRSWYMPWLATRTCRTPQTSRLELWSPKQSSVQLPLLPPR
jgi:hypothetical protein